MTLANRDRIVAVLSAEASPMRDELVALGVNHVLSQKLEDLVDVREAGNIVLAALTNENVARAVSRHIAPGFRRYLATVATTKDTVGTLVPTEARLEIHAIA